MGGARLSKKLYNASSPLPGSNCKSCWSCWLTTGSAAASDAGGSSGSDVVG